MKVIVEALLEPVDEVLEPLWLFLLPSCVDFLIGSDAVLKRLCGCRLKYSSELLGSVPAIGVRARLCIGLMRIASGLHDHLWLPPVKDLWCFLWWVGRIAGSSSREFMPIHIASSSSSPESLQPPTPSKSLFGSPLPIKDAKLSLFLGAFRMVGRSWEDAVLVPLLRRLRWR